MIENRLVGIKSREIYEAPAAALLLAAYAGVEELVCDRDLAHMKAELAARLRDARLQRALVLAASRCARGVHGPDRPPPSRATARVKLYRGSCAIVGRRAESSLYDHGLATYEHGDSFQHGAAAGFIHIWSLPTKTWAAAGTVAGDGSGMTQALWSGRLPGGLDPDVKAFTASLAVDRRLLPYDLRATRAHVRMLAARGILDPELATEICAALDGVEIAPTPPTRTSTRRSSASSASSAGGSTPAAAETTRSQTAMRLWVKDACDELAAGLRGAGRRAARPRRARRRRRPPRLHARPARPARLAGQHLAAHVWALARDIDRFRAVHRRADTCPSGAGALAGSSLPLDPAAVASELGLRRGARELDRRRGGPRLLRRARVRVHARVLAPLAHRRGARALDVGGVRLRRARRRGGDRLVDDAAEEEPRRRRAGARPRRAPPRAARRPARDAEGAPARVQPRPPGGQAGLLRRGRRPGRRAAGAHRVHPGITFHPERMAAAAGDGWCVATDVAEAMVREGTPFRAAHTAVAGRVAAGERFSSPAPAEAAAARQPPDALRIQLARARAAVGGMANRRPGPAPDRRRQGRLEHARRRRRPRADRRLRAPGRASARSFRPPAPRSSS